jgi:hypothetical protein
MMIDDAIELVDRWLDAVDTAISGHAGANRVAGSARLCRDGASSVAARRV